MEKEKNRKERERRGRSVEEKNKGYKEERGKMRKIEKEENDEGGV